MKIVSILTLMILLSLVSFSQDIKMRISLKDGTVEAIPIAEIRKITFAGISGISQPQLPKIVSNLMLLNNYPNPFTSNTTIQFELPDNGYVQANIIDLAGKQIKSLVSRELFKGKIEVIWDGCDQSGASATPGVYLCVIKYRNQIFSRKLMFIK